jgi:aldose 1-epimerase
MTDDPLLLRNGPLSLELRPEHGGAIAAFELERAGGALPLFRRALPLELRETGASAASCFPLIPFSNRIENGEFSFGGRDYHMSPNLPPHPHPLHGHGWSGRWNVVEAAASRALLSFEHDAADWPSRYVATQKFELGPSALTIELGLRNAGSVTMPAGLGLHPFFPRSERVRLKARLTEVWLSREDRIPEKLVGVPEVWDFSEARAIDGIELDHCFGGWDGRAEVEWPEHGLRLGVHADALFGHAVVYTPAGRDFFCFEPVSHANAALNLAQRGVARTGLALLEPGATLLACVRFSIG